MDETLVEECCFFFFVYVLRRRDTILQNALAIVAPAIPILDGVIHYPKWAFGVHETPCFQKNAASRVDETTLYFENVRFA